MDRLDVMRLFVRVVETSSFSRAAKAEGLVQPTVSKQIASLEARLGAQLLRRTSRGLSVTEAGQSFYGSAVKLLDDFDQVENSVRRHQASPAGHMRVAMSAGFGRMHILPRLPTLLAKYPELTIETDISDRHINLVENGIDVAIRIGALADSSLIARRIGSGETAVVAARSYVENHGEPLTLNELARHPCVAFVSAGAVRPWNFQGPNGPVLVQPKGPIRTSDAEHIRASVLSGFGFAQAPTWLFPDELASGSVVRVLSDRAPAPHAIFVVTPSGRLQSSKVRVFIDFLAEVFSRDELLKLR